MNTFRPVTCLVYPILIPAVSSVALILAAPESHAQQTISGDHIAIDYNSDGLWVDSSADTDGDGFADGGGLRVRSSSTGTFQNVTYPGTPWQQTSIHYKKNSGGAATVYSGNETGASWTTTSESDISTSTIKGSEYEFTAGVLDVVQTDKWLVKGKVIQMNYAVTNSGTKTAYDVMVVHGMDVDVDYDTYADFDTYNDSVDTDSDGTLDYVKSEGEQSGWTVSYGICDATLQEVGHSSWSTSPTVAFVDDGDVAADRQMHIRHKAGNLAAGASIEFSFVLVFDTSPANAEKLYTTNVGTACGCDSDGDGFDAISCGGSDCNDADASIYPGAPEYCNSVDDDCNGIIDDDYAVDAVDWYADDDGDGYGDLTTVDTACDAATGYVADDTDCDDTDKDVNPGADEVCNGIDDDCDTLIDDKDPSLDLTSTSTYYKDSDSDGYGDPGSSTDSCTAPTGYVTDDSDCDDTDPKVNPAASEICNGIDDDCDSLIDDKDSSLDTSTATAYYADSDGDGYGTSTPTYQCSATSGYVTNDTDCDDSNSAVNPGASEVCNGIDDDCDTLIDKADSSLDTSTTKTYYKDSDSDGYGDPSTSTLECTPPSGYVVDDSDCDDTNAAVNPAASEVCNGIDDDCDTLIDSADPSLDTTSTKTYYADTDKDGYGDPATAKTTCTAPAGYVEDDTDCDDTDIAVNPAATEYCDSIDNDCDGVIDEDDAFDAKTWHADDDGDAYGDATDTKRACSKPSGYVIDDTDCDDTEVTTYPGADEYCDGEDNDCDGVIDEDTALDAKTWYADADGDTYGDATVTDVECYQPSGYVSDDTDCDDTDSDIYPGATEVPYDGIDDDCDGSDLTDVDGDGYDWDGVFGGTDCDDTDAAINPGATESADGADEDCDGTVDEGTEYYDDDGDGYTEAGGDCDDSDASIHPSATETCDGVDEDCDGIIDEETDCYDDDGDGYTEDDGDCNDGDDSVHPGATEIMGDGIDNDCDGIVDDGSFDGDKDGYTVDAGDCDDKDDTVYPGAPEVCDGIDNDCDGIIDEGTECYDDDGDGYSEEEGDCDDSNPDIGPDAEEIANGIDDDCDGDVDEGTEFFDDDGDGFTEEGGDCDDENPDISPSAEEIQNGVDDDCDDRIDEGLDDSDGDGVSVDDGDCDDSNGWVHPDMTEMCDGIDNNCDGVIDEGCEEVIERPEGECGCSATVGFSGGAAPVFMLLALIGGRRRQTRVSNAQGGAQ